MGRLTKAQRGALVFALANGEDGCVLFEYLDAGHSLVTLMAMNRRGLMSWTSTYTMATCVLPSEYAHLRDTTSYVWITPAGRTALGASDE